MLCRLVTARQDTILTRLRDAPISDWQPVRTGTREFTMNLKKILAAPRSPPRWASALLDLARVWRTPMMATGPGCRGCLGILGRSLTGILERSSVTGGFRGAIGFHGREMMREATSH